MSCSRSVGKKLAELLSYKGDGHLRQGMGLICCTAALLFLITGVSSKFSAHLCPEGTLLQEVCPEVKLCLVPCSCTYVAGAVETFV